MGPVTSFREAQGNNAPGGRKALGRPPAGGPVAWGAGCAASWILPMGGGASASCGSGRRRGFPGPPLLCLEIWESPLAPLGGLGFWQTPAASANAFPGGGRHLFPTSCCADVALEAPARCLVVVGCAETPRRQEEFRVPASEAPFPCLSWHAVCFTLPLSRKTKASRALLHLATLGTSVSLSTLSGRTRRGLD